MNETTGMHPHEPPEATRELLDMLHQEAAPMPRGLTDRVIEGWHGERRRRSEGWMSRFRRPRAGLHLRRRVVAWAACAALGVYGTWGLLDQQLAGQRAEELMTPDALAELSGGLL